MLKQQEGELLSGMEEGEITFECAVRAGLLPKASHCAITSTSPLNPWEPADLKPFYLKVAARL